MPSELVLSCSDVELKEGNRLLLSRLEIILNSCCIQISKVASSSGSSDLAEDIL